MCLTFPVSKKVKDMILNRTQIVKKKEYMKNDACNNDKKEVLKNPSHTPYTNMYIKPAFSQLNS